MEKAYNAYKSSITNLLLIVVVSKILASVNGRDNKTSTCFNSVEAIRTLFDPKIYDKEMRPCENGEPVIVYAGIYIVSINKVEESDMELDIQVYFRQKWKDPRLEFDRAMLLNASNKPYFEFSPGDVSDAIWMPDPYFENEKSAKLHTIMSKNQLLRIFPEGTVFLSTRLTLTLSCPMEFYDFPMDKQICPMTFLSYGHSASNLEYRWLTNKSETSVESTTLKLPQFNLSKIETESRVDRYLVGDFKVLAVYLHLDRRLEFYLTRNYIPAALVVKVSWLSFWVDRDCAPARVGMGITTILTMTTLLIGVGQQQLPVVSYMKALDWYYIGCFVFVFAALCEYAVVNYFDSKYRRQVNEMKLKIETPTLDEAKGKVKSNMCVENYGFRYGMECQADEPGKNSQHAKLKVKRAEDSKYLPQLADSIDSAVRIIYPLLFLIFNIVYWTAYRKSFSR